MEEPVPREPRRASRSRLVGVAFASPILTLILAALLAPDSYGYWGTFAATFAVFLMVGALGGLVAGRDASIAVGVGLGATWGVIALSLLVVSAIQGRLHSSAVFALIYVVGAVAAAYWFGRRRPRRKVESPR